MNCKSIRFNLISDLGGHLNGINLKNLNSLNSKKNEQDIHNNLNDEFNDDTSDYISSFENQEQHLFSYKLNLTKEDDDSTNLNSNRYQQNNLKFNLNYLKLDSFDRKIFSAQDERDAMQKKTFTKWINKYLNEIGNNINDLYEDLKDGTNLLLLLQILTKKTFTKERGNSKFHSLQNIRICLDYLKSNKLKLVNIHCEDIFYGNPKITLGLVWILISYFQA
ncbi:microtubule-actin cross-linking factor 1 [Brachionus plicatilis]|uniref:Microtubule-actin cross-linking factor 1 n=1 Tax=Brachionus plicatilis TaxID=10195 RepID=A0A3M7T936_BRAPC|nr:microtubule-actin cross-linking factor 1 [Brachionus plicatilis]